MHEVIEMIMFSESVKINEYTGKQEKFICDSASKTGVIIDRLNDGTFVVRTCGDCSPLYYFIYELSKEYDVKVV